VPAAEVRKPGERRSCRTALRRSATQPVLPLRRACAIEWLRVPPLLPLMTVLPYSYSTRCNREIGRYQGTPARSSPNLEASNHSTAHRPNPRFKKHTYHRRPTASSLRRSSADKHGQNTRAAQFRASTLIGLPHPPSSTPTGAVHATHKTAQTTPLPRHCATP
jgi:hypothetical protein